MNHNEARLLIGADPHSTPPELAEHLADCPECSRFQHEMIALDGNIRRALGQAPVTAEPPVVTSASVTPITSTPTAQRRRRASSWTGWALAAGVAAISMIAVWTLRPNDSLAHDVVAHIQ